LILVITGGELVFGPGSVLFSFPQHSIPTGVKRKEKRIKLLISNRDSGYSFLRNEKIEMLLFSMNLSERVD
jgi:hypothetical protein